MLDQGSETTLIVKASCFGPVVVALSAIWDVFSRIFGGLAHWLGFSASPIHGYYVLKVREVCRNIICLVRRPGESKDNGLPTCQLQSIQTLVDSIYPDGESVPLWIDTLSVPRDPKWRRIAIGNMHNVYRHADKVLVLDRFLRLAPITGGPEEAMQRIKPRIGPKDYGHCLKVRTRRRSTFNLRSEA